MAAVPLYCVCRQPYDVSRFMIECDICKDWFHGSCVQVEEHHAVDIDVYHCPNCDVVHGPSLMKKRNNWHRHDYTEPDDGSKPVQAGTPVFIKELQNRTFPSGEEILIRMKGELVTTRYLERHGFNYPIAVTEMEDLGLKLPPPTFSVKDVEQYVGWIHAVLTSQDCMAFGGNFLHNLNIGMQLRCYEMERRLKTPDLFKFPYFEAICWYVAKNLLEMLKELREDNCTPPAYIVEGVKALILAVKTWLKREVTEPTSEVPDNIRPNHLIKELTKEIRYLEEEPVSGNKPVKSQGSGCGVVLTGCPATRSTLERLCQARRARRAARRLREQQQQQGPKVPSNLDILEQHTKEVLKRLEMGPLEEDPAFCAKVHGKLNKVSTASAAAAAESLEDNHLRLMLVNGRIMRDMRRPCSSPVKSEGEQSSVCQGPPKSRVDVKSERTRDGREPQSLDDKPTLLGGLERVKTELREDVSGHSGVSDGESDSDSSAERKPSLASSSSDEDSESSQEEEEEEEEEDREKGSGQLDQSGHKLRHKHKPLKRERPTSPTTAEAIQGMLSMAGLLCSSEPEKVASSQDSWWSGPSRCSSLDQRESAQQQRRLQVDKSPMDSQGNSSSEAWDNQGPPSPYGRTHATSPETDYQYCDPSMSPPLHPSKRHAPNPPPISNQATKGKRPKKGMATAKQRLGKILKINRHSRVFV
ncbi:lysine-specific demethylase 7A isoform X2 [Channa argus]|uniref:lysine-specific demethylase 7A isoform X2 n=1 Tax=Channa argus TaxID=215402 RepID=UPI003522FB3F